MLSAHPPHGPVAFFAVIYGAWVWHRVVDDHRLAMALPGFYVLQDPILENFKKVLQQHLRVPPMFEATRCITCENANTRSTGGVFEHTRSGVCEACWDVLVRDDITTNAKLTQCTRLRDEEACAFIGTWIMISKTARGGRLHMPHAGAEIAIAMTLGLRQPPVVWIAGREPPVPDPARSSG